MTFSKTFMAETKLLLTRKDIYKINKTKLKGRATETVVFVTA